MGILSSWKSIHPVAAIRRLVKGSNSSALTRYFKSQNEYLKSRYSNHIETTHKISLITPLFNTSRSYLSAMLDSVVNQSLGAWELCLVNFSDEGYEYIDEICNEYANIDNRIRYKRANKNEGISMNSNTCAQLATGDYIGVLDHDDILHPFAISAVIDSIEKDNADFIYSDEVKFKEKTEDAFYPNLKPDFSVDELRAHNFICHFNVFSKKLFDDVGGYREGFDGSQDHDLVLRLTERANKIVHLPYILYYWRVHDGSVAKSIDAKPYATLAGEKAVTEQLRRAGIDAHAESITNNIPIYRLRSHNDSKVNLTVAIWGCDSDDEFSIVEKRFKDYDCSIIDARIYNNSLNTVMKAVDTKYVLFVYKDVIVDYDGITEELVVYKSRNDICSIDLKLFDKGNKILSGGAFYDNRDGLSVRPRCIGGGKDYYGYENALLYTRTVVCSFGLCTVVDKETWNPGLCDESEESMGVSLMRYSDNARDKGLINLLLPYYEARCSSDEGRNELLSALSDCGIEHQRDPYFNISVLDMHLE